MEVATVIETAALDAKDRFDLWSRVINGLGLASVAEVGVFEGNFAQRILQECGVIDKYYLIDPWRHLDDWNKPANRTNDEFIRIKDRAIAKTEFAAGKRIILQGKTTEIAASLPEHGLDLVYVDADHTLRGIATDLITLWPKIRLGGILGGDDFCKSVWLHGPAFEPTLVFPFAVYFAEAVGSIIYGLPFQQFAIVAAPSGEAEFEFRDLTGEYASTALRDSLSVPRGGFLKKASRKLFGSRLI